MTPAGNQPASFPLVLGIQPNTRNHGRQNGLLPKQGKVCLHGALTSKNNSVSERGSVDVLPGAYGVCLFLATPGLPGKGLHPLAPSVSRVAHLVFLLFLVVRPGCTEDRAENRGRALLSCAQRGLKLRALPQLALRAGGRRLRAIHRKAWKRTK